MTPEQGVREVKDRYSGYIAEHKKLIQAMLFEAVGEADIEDEKEAVAAIRSLRERAEKAEKRLAEIEPLFRVCSREEFARREQCQELKVQLETAKGEAKSFKDTIISIYRHIFANLSEFESPLGNRLQSIAARCTLAVPEIDDPATKERP